MTANQPACVGCGAARPDDGPPTCPHCGLEGRAYRETLVSTMTITMTVDDRIGTRLWPSWARRAISGLDDIRAVPPSSDPDDLAEIANVMANASFALEGVRGDLVSSGHATGQHHARVAAQPKGTANGGDYTAATFLDALGRPADTGAWQARMHRVFHIRNQFAGHPRTRMGPVSPARVWLTAVAAEHAVTLLRECLAALHDANKVTVPDDLR